MDNTNQTEDTGELQHNVPTPAELAALYPTAKTEAERHQDTIKRQALLRSRQPKHSYGKITLAFTTIFSLLLLLSVNAQSLWMGGLAGVSFSFALLLVILLFTAIAISYTTNVFYAFGQSARLFYSLYICIAFGIFGASVSGWLGSTSGGYLWLLFAAGLHATILYSVLKFTLKTSL